MQLLRILPHSPYIPQSQELVEEYTQVNKLDIPLELFLSRSQKQAQPLHQAISLYIPDRLEDRALLKIFKNFDAPAVDFGLFRDRVHRGWTYEKVALKPSLQKKRYRQNKAKPHGLKDYYSNADRSPEVAYGTFYARVKYLHWTVEKALYTPAQ